MRPIESSDGEHRQFQKSEETPTLSPFIAETQRVADSLLQIDIDRLREKAEKLAKNKDIAKRLMGKIVLVSLPPERHISSPLDSVDWRFDTVDQASVPIHAHVTRTLGSDFGTPSFVHAGFEVFDYMSVDSAPYVDGHETAFARTQQITRAGHLGGSLRILPFADYRPQQKRAKSPLDAAAAEMLVDTIRDRQVPYADTNDGSYSSRLDTGWAPDYSVPEQPKTIQS